MARALAPLVVVLGLVVPNAVPAYADASGLTATAVSDRQVNLSWTHLPNAYWVQLRRCQGYGCEIITPIANFLPNPGSYVDTGLQPDTWYSYQAWGPNGYFNATVRTGYGLRATAVSNRQINLDWSSVPDGGPVYIRRCQGAGCDIGGAPVIASGLANPGTYQDQGLAPGTTYSYAVVGSNGYYLNSATTGYGLLATAVGYSAVDLTWSHVPDAGPVYLRRCQGAGCSIYDAPVIAYGLANPGSFRDTQVAPGTTYSYLVVGSNGYYGATVTMPGFASTLTVAPTSAVYGGPAVIRATLSGGAGNGPLSGEPVTFTVGGVAYPAVNTDGNGVAALSLANLGRGTGSYPGLVTAAFAGDGADLAATAAGDVTVTPAPLTITADSQSKVYGAALPTLTVSYSGFVNGDSVSSLGSPAAGATTATQASGVGNYPITASGAADPNYTITYVAGVLTVTPAPLTVRVDDQSRYYHQSNPAFTGSVTGIVLNDQIAPNYFTAATAASPAGTYAISAAPSGPAIGNYAVTVVNGTLTVNQMPTTLTFSKPVFTSATGGSSVITAVLSEALTPGGTIAGQTVSCDFGGGRTATATTDANGVATCSVTGVANGRYTVNAAFAGDHNYVGSTASAATLFMYQATNFVIWGGNSPSLGTAVPVGADFNFWGAQWASQVKAGSWNGNPSFKGYADTVSNGTWSAASGNSSKPVATVGQYIGVVVATQATKTGSATTGNVAEMVVIKVDSPSTYQPNPGHPASGVVQAVIS